MKLMSNLDNSNPLNFFWRLMHSTHPNKLMSDQPAKPPFRTDGVEDEKSRSVYSSRVQIPDEHSSEDGLFRTHNDYRSPSWPCIQFENQICRQWCGLIIKLTHVIWNIYVWNTKPISLFCRIYSLWELPTWTGKKVRSLKGRLWR